MSVEKVQTLVIGAGQAGVAMSEHLSANGVSHLVLERHRIAERWRSERWDSLVSNGPSWHDRFPSMTFPGVEPDSFAPKDAIADYFAAYAEKIRAPIRCGVEVLALEKLSQGGFRATTSAGEVQAENVVVATGPFQQPVIPPLVPPQPGLTQLHSNAYHNPEQLADGAVLVVGAGSSGAQIAEEIMRSGRRVYLSVGPHNRPPRRYRGHDFVWWLDALGLWDAKTYDPRMEHVAIAVSGANGGQTVDFRKLAAEGVILVGRVDGFDNGVLRFAPDLVENIAQGDSDYLSVLDAVDAHIAKAGLDLPEEPGARTIAPDPACLLEPLSSLNLKQAGITTILWATGYKTDFSWIKLDVFDEKDRPKHARGVSVEPGLYFIGLPWLSRRASAFIWGVWQDAADIAKHIADNARAPAAKPLAR